MRMPSSMHSSVVRFATGLLALTCLLALAVVHKPVVQAAATASGLEATNSVAPTANISLFIPMVLRADPYAAWVSLGQPTGVAAVNFVYISQSCAGDLPATILAGTDNGLYSFNARWVHNLSLPSAISVSHIISTTAGLFLGSYDDGLWHSTDNGATWVSVALPNLDSRIYWLTASSDYIYVAGEQGVYRKSGTGGDWSVIRAQPVYVIAATGRNVYAAVVGNPKDTLLISSDGGNTWPVQRQLPGAINFVQTLDAALVTPQLLIGTVGGGLYMLDGTDTIVPFSQGVNATVYGIWRDSQARIYAALAAPGGLRRFPAAGGASDFNLSTLPSGGSLTTETLYTVNGSQQCNVIVVGSKSGNVWVRRVP